MEDGVSTWAGLRRAHEDRADRRAIAVQHLDGVEQDIGRIQVRADQDIGLALEPAVHEIAAANGFRQRRIGVHLAIALDVRRQLREDLVGLAHARGRLAPRGAVIGVRQEGDLGRQTEQMHFLGGLQRDLRQQLRRGHFVDVGVGDEQACGPSSIRPLRVARQGASVRRPITSLIFARCASKRPCRPQSMASASPRFTIRAAMVVVERRTAFLAASGLMPRRPMHVVIGLPVLLEARIIVRIDQLDVLARAQSQAGLGDALLNDRGPADQDGFGQTIIERELRGAQGAHVLAFGDRRRGACCEARAAVNTGCMTRPPAANICMSRCR